MKTSARPGWWRGAGFLLRGAAGGLVFLIGGACAFSQASGPVFQPESVVLITDYSRATAAVLAGAEREAGRILTEAGMRVAWVECPVGQAAADPVCGQKAQPTDLRLRILATPGQNKPQDTLFGFAVHPMLASVYYEYVERLAKIDGADFELPIVLGCVIAHEIGHRCSGRTAIPPAASCGLAGERSGSNRDDGEPAFPG